MPGGSGEPMAITSKATRKAVAMRFGILGPEEVSAMSAAQVDTEVILNEHRQNM